MDQGFLFPSELIQPRPLSTINPFSYPNIDHRNGLPQLNPPVYGASLDPLGFGALHNAGTSSESSSNFGSIHAKLIGRMSAQEIMDAKALAVSKNHSEAERRRRERINGHLGRLRSLLPNTTKTDKASLLAEVIQHVKELRRQTSKLAEDNPLPTETDELTVNAAGGGNEEGGGFVIKASLCCDDRPDLIPNLAKALKSLKLRTLKAEITTLGGRVKNILVVAGEDESMRNRQLRISSVREALKATMERGAADDLHSPGGINRQRTNHLSSIMLRQRTPF